MTGGLCMVKSTIWKKAFVFFFAFLLVFVPIGKKEEVQAKGNNVERLSKTSLTLKQGKKTTLKLLNAKGKAVFKSNNTSVVTVTKYTGKVTAKNIGTTTITVTSKNGKKYTCKVKVFFGDTVAPKEDETLVAGKQLQVVDGVSLTLPDGWDYEQLSDEKNFMQYICINLPDDEYKGCVYVNMKPYTKAVSMKSYIPTQLKTLVTKMKNDGYYVQWASTGMTEVQEQEVGIMSFWAKKGMTQEYETIFVQKKGSYIFTIECIGTSKAEREDFAQAALYMLNTLTVA